MAIVGNLIINVAAKIKDFVTPLAQSRTELNSWAAGIRKTVGIATVAFAGLAATSALKSRAEEISQITKTARGLHLATADLQAYHAAAKKVGSSGESIETAFRRMLKTIGEAALGSAEAQKKLTALGFTAAQLQAAGPDRAFRMIANAIKAIKDPAEQTATTFEIFGRGAGDLVPLFAQGSKAIDDASAKLRELGLAVSDAEAAKIEQAAKSMHEMGKVISGINTQILIAIAPAIEEVNKTLAKSAASGNGVSAAFSNVAGFLSQCVSWAVQLYDKMLAWAKGLGQYLTGFAGWATQWIPGMATLSEEMRAQEEGIDNVASSEQEAAKWQREHANAAAAATVEITKQTEALEKQRKFQERALLANADQKPQAVLDDQLKLVQDMLKEIEDRVKRSADALSPDTWAEKEKQLRRAGANDETIELAKGRFEHAQVDEREKKFQDLKKQVETATEKFEAKEKEIADFAKRGYDPAVIERARLENFKELQKAQEAAAPKGTEDKTKELQQKTKQDFEPRLAAALERGSAGALSAIAHADNRGPNSVAEQHLKHAAKTNRLLEEIKNSSGLEVAGV